MTTRREFLRMLGLGAGIVALAPVLDLVPPEFVACTSLDATPFDIEALNRLMREVWQDVIIREINKPNVLQDFFER